MNFTKHDLLQACCVQVVNCNNISFTTNLQTPINSIGVKADFCLLLFFQRECNHSTCVVKYAVSHCGCADGDERSAAWAGAALTEAGWEAVCPSNQNNPVKGLLGTAGQYLQWR